ncbi:MAG: tyrosine--tRNA ligase [Chloroflexi bacterium]|nr:tyrosine--tRNA ligase [Chloroflexota bacterium]
MTKLSEIKEAAKKDLDLLKRGAEDIISEEELLAKLIKSRESGRPLVVKLGLDPTAPDIHLGFAVVLRKLRQFQDLGHTVTLIIGDFTALVGDPTGRNETRKVLTPEEIAQNAATYKEQFGRILDRDRTVVRFNSEWLGPMNFAGVVGLGAKTTVAKILTREDFAKRYREGIPIGLHELLYPLMQAYDSVALNADVELGGTDQTFNILMGRDLQREFGQEPQVALFTPLLEGLDGVQKMSKSLGNYIGISEPPEEMFGKVMSIPDELMERYFILAAEMPEAEVKAILKDVKDGVRHPRDVKKMLAHKITAIYHGEDAAKLAGEEFERIFKRKELPSDMDEVKITGAEASCKVSDLLVQSGLADSKREARRLIEQGGVSLGGEKIQPPDQTVEIKDGMVLKVGSRKFVRIKL